MAQTTGQSHGRKSQQKNSCFRWDLNMLIKFADPRNDRDFCINSKRSICVNLKHTNDSQSWWVKISGATKHRSQIISLQCFTYQDFAMNNWDIVKMGNQRNINNYHHHHHHNSRVKAMRESLSPSTGSENRWNYSFDRLSTSKLRGEISTFPSKCRPLRRRRRRTFLRSECLGYTNKQVW